jgi:hypothetical protein
MRTDESVHHQELIHLRRLYGILNIAAHPSNFPELHSLLSLEDGAHPIHPVRIQKTEVASIESHAWLVFSLQLHPWSYWHCLLSGIHMPI